MASGAFPVPLAGAGAGDEGPGWFEDLTDVVGEAALQELARELWSEVEAAERSRKDWNELYAEGLRKLGIDRTERTRDRPFQGASAVRHSMLMQACVEFQSRSMSELCPPGGPAKGVLAAGADDPDGTLQERADRVAKFVNWEWCEQVDEAACEQDRLLMMLPLEGSSFSKLWWDPGYGRARYSYIPASSVIMPYHSGDEMTAPLLAHKLEVMPHQARAHVASGLWRAHEMRQSPRHETTPEREQEDRVTGLAPTAGEVTEHEPLVYYECAVRRVIPGLDAEGEAEWLVTIAGEGLDTVAIRRNWRETDRRRGRIRRIFHWKMFPWSGAFGVGFLHLIGGLNDAATGALRALLDGAAISNMAGGFALKRGAAGSARDRGPLNRSPGVYVEVDAPGVDDIRKVIMADPYPGPSGVLHELMGTVVDSGRRFASVALQELAEATGNVPVGTTLARVEEGSRIYGQVFARLHRTMGQVLRELDTLNREHVTPAWLEDTFVVPPLEPGDMDPRVDVAVVSDPRTFSHVQRVMHGQISRELVAQAKEMGVEVDARIAFVMAAKAVGLPNAEALFPEPEEPIHHVDPKVENAALMAGQKLRMEQGDDHPFHILAHLLPLQLPGILTTPGGQQLAEHVVEHAAFLQDFADYSDVFHQLLPAFETADPQGVRQIAAVEKAKVEAKVAEVVAKLEADEKRIKQTVDAKIEEIEAHHDAKMAEIAATMQAKREGNASQERQTSANVAAKVETDAARREMDREQREKDREREAEERERDRQLGLATGLLDKGFQADQGEADRHFKGAEAERGRQEADKDRKLDILRRGEEGARADQERAEGRQDTRQSAERERRERREDRQHEATQAEADRKVQLEQAKAKAQATPKRPAPRKKK